MKSTRQKVANEVLRVGDFKSGKSVIFYLVLALASLFSFSCKNKSKYPHDVGHIDPANALGDDDFETCSPGIYEYYNSTPHAGFKFGKMALVDSVTSRFNKVSNDSGYFTVRFIVNCKGVPGRYEILESDLNFSPTRFSPQLRQQLFVLTQDLESWSPLVIDSDPKDAYLYLTYRLKDGNIIDILP